MGVRIGVDVGERSVGFAVVEYDDDGWPVQVLNAVSHVHDGGMDPDTAKSPLSRLATAGVARRTRRLIRNRRRRLRELDQVLEKHGFPVPQGEVPQTHEVWHARARLVAEWVVDDAERVRLVSLAVRHVARHRGWRNPWWGFDRLEKMPFPSEQLRETVQGAEARFGSMDGVQFLGELVSRVAGSGVPIRPTKRAQAGSDGAVISHQVRQEDSLAEVRRMLQMQRLSAVVVEEICRAVFFQNRPRIPKERIGSCALQRDQLRAPLASLEFQEFRVRSAVANLRIGVGQSKRQLTADEHDRAVALLMGWRDEVRPRWRDVADALGVGARELVDTSIDGSGSSFAPHDRTSAAVEGKVKASSKVGEWWSAASWAQRAELVRVVTDLSGEDGDLEDDAVALLLSRDDVLEPLAKMNDALESGRAAYGLGTLTELNRVMREDRCDLHQARIRAFGVDDSWQPPRPRFDDPVEHPAVSRVNVLVRRYLMAVTQRWGMPERVVIEHVRNAFAGPTGLAEIKREIQSNTNKRRKSAEELVQQGIPDPGRAAIRRNECVQRQNATCLYCGATITLLTCELDHIVPRAGGGSNRIDNLVAVCRACNAAKGRLPFSVWAQQHPSPDVSVERAQARVKDWQRTGMTERTMRRLRSDVKRRLALTKDDEMDERSLESTAYAARQMRARIESFLDDLAAGTVQSRGSVLVFGGAVTSEARRAGGIDDRLRLRSFTRKTRPIHLQGRDQAMRGDEHHPVDGSDRIVRRPRQRGVVLEHLHARVLLPARIR
ncbi:MAG: HNH endonuclease [Chloroflexi bacterium]|nr:HNH endonuclease [Chloroflexota bacterium]